MHAARMKMLTIAKLRSGTTGLVIMGAGIVTNVAKFHLHSGLRPTMPVKTSEGWLAVPAPIVINHNRVPRFWLLLLRAGINILVVHTQNPIYHTNTQKIQKIHIRKKNITNTYTKIEKHTRPRKNHRINLQKKILRKGRNQ